MTIQLSLKTKSIIQYTDQLSVHEKPAASIETGKRTKELKNLEANSNPRPRVGGF